MIRSSRTSQGAVDRGLECEFAIEQDFLELASRAQSAGWTEIEVATSLSALARYFWLAVSSKTTLRSIYVKSQRLN
jgi:hypothetical protein